MNQIDQALKELLSAIRSSSEYEEYQEVRTRVHMEPELEGKIHEFRKKNYELQNAKISGDRLEQVEQLSREYAKLLEQPLVNRYLTAELSFCRVIQNINWEIVKGIDFDVGFVNEQM